MEGPPPPPPPPPHGENPQNTAGGGGGKRGGLPDGNYDIFIIPPHSSGGGFLYLPSLQTQRNSFIAGVICTVAVIGVWMAIFPIVKEWYLYLANGGTVTVGFMLVIVASITMLLTYLINERGGGGFPRGPGGTAGTDSGHGANNQRNTRSGFSGGFPGAGPGGFHQNAPKQEPPPHGSHHSQYQYGGGFEQHSAPPPREPEPDIHSEPDTESTFDARANAGKPQSDSKDEAKKAWERAKQETRRKEEEKRRSEELRKKAEELRKKREAEEKRKREQQEREEKEMRERIEKEEREKREQLEKEEKEKQAQRDKEARERGIRERRERLAREREERLKKEKEEKEREEQERLTREAREREAKEKAELEAKLEAKLKAAQSAKDVQAEHAARAAANLSPPKSTSNFRRPTAKTEADHEEVYSYRPYDQPKSNKSSPKKVPPTVYTSSAASFTASSYAASDSTSRTTPPPSHRNGTYSTKDPEKIVIKAVYSFNKVFSKMPLSQLVSGVTPVTDGLILRITTAGMFIDDDVRAVAQREWDIKAWTLKLLETGDYKGMHLIRANLRDQEGKNYVFLLDQTETWKATEGLQRMKKGPQARSLGLSGMTEKETKSILENLGWA